MVKHYPLLLLVFLILSGLEVQAQKFNVSFGMNLGGARLNHKTRFETTTLRNLYETIAITHSEDYDWEQFEKDFELRQNFNQLRFGFFVRASHRNFPLLVIAEAMSSTSTYEKLAYSATIGFGQEFDILEDKFQCSFLGGYKFIWDKGFGASTLVKSIGHNEARNLVATYFAPVKPLGPNIGNLFVLRGGLGRTIDQDQQWSVGIDLYGELDLTARIRRESRMTNYGFNLLLKYNMHKKRKTPAFNNNPNFYQ